MLKIDRVYSVLLMQIQLYQKIIYQLLVKILKKKILMLQLLILDIKILRILLLMKGLENMKFLLKKLLIILKKPVLHMDMLA